MNQQLEAIRLWHSSLPERDKKLLIAISTLLIITVFYLMVWEPLHEGRELQLNKNKTQRETHAWMLSAASEANKLKRTGTNISTSRQPISLILENTAKIAGLKQHINKIESAGKNGARIKIDSASFDQLMIWLNTLEQKHGVIITTASIERNDNNESVSARISFEKP